MIKGSEFIEWAKLHAAAPYNLATSGVLSYSIRELEMKRDDLALSGVHGYGYPLLVQGIATKCGVSDACVVTAMGTSFANHLVMGALLDRGDEVVIEQPAYEPLLAVANYLGAEVKRFHRRREDDFRIDVDELRRVVTPRTRLIVLTNLHNPTSARVDDETLRNIREIARNNGARVLVDEVYLELYSVYERPARSAFHLGKEFIVTSSLTKAYGLSGLRCGWILAQPDLAAELWRFSDLFYATPAHPAERFAAVAFRQLDRIGWKAQSLLKANRRLLDQFLDSCDALETVRPEIGTVVFPRLKRGNVDALCTLLRDKYETSIVPGRFFELPDHFRLGIGGETAQLEQGLERLQSALKEI